MLSYQCSNGNGARRKINVTPAPVSGRIHHVCVAFSKDGHCWMSKSMAFNLSTPLHSRWVPTPVLCWRAKHSLCYGLFCIHIHVRRRTTGLCYRQLIDVFTATYQMTLSHHNGSPWIHLNARFRSQINISWTAKHRSPLLRSFWLQRQPAAAAVGTALYTLTNDEIAGCYPSAKSPRMNHHQNWMNVQEEQGWI